MLIWSAGPMRILENQNCFSNLKKPIRAPGAGRSQVSKILLTIKIKSSIWLVGMQESSPVNQHCHLQQSWMHCHEREESMSKEQPCLALFPSCYSSSSSAASHDTQLTSPSFFLWRNQSCGHPTCSFNASTFHVSGLNHSLVTTTASKSNRLE